MTEIIENTGMNLHEIMIDMKEKYISTDIYQKLCEQMNTNPNDLYEHVYEINTQPFKEIWNNGKPIKTSIYDYFSKLVRIAVIDGHKYGINFGTDGMGAIVCTNEAFEFISKNNNLFSKLES